MTAFAAEHIATHSCGPKPGRSAHRSTVGAGRALGRHGALVGRHDPQMAATRPWPLLGYHAGGEGRQEARCVGVRTKNSVRSNEQRGRPVAHTTGSAGGTAAAVLGNPRTSPTYAITGASGRLGRLAVAELLARGVPASDVVAALDASIARGERIMRPRKGAAANIRTKRVAPRPPGRGPNYHIPTGAS
jgi:hypothetical protein